MKEILEIVLQYVAIWAPSLVAILGIVYSVLVAVNKTKAQWDKLKGDTDFKDVKEQLVKQSKENEELIKCNKALIDNITKIKDYVDHKGE